MVIILSGSLLISRISLTQLSLDKCGRILLDKMWSRVSGFLWFLDLLLMCISIIWTYISVWLRYCRWESRRGVDSSNTRDSPLSGTYFSGDCLDVSCSSSLLRSTCWVILPLREWGCLQQSVPYHRSNPLEEESCCCRVCSKYKVGRYVLRPLLHRTMFPYRVDRRLQQPYGIFQGHQGILSKYRWRQGPFRKEASSWNMQCR